MADQVRPTGEAVKEKAPLFSRNFGLLVLCHFFQALGWSSMLLLPKYFDALGHNSASIGILMASAALGGLVIRPVIGWALDVYSKRLVLTIGSCILAVGMFTLSHENPSFERLLFARICVGMGAGTLFTGYFAFVAQHIPQHRRTEGLALFGISGLLPVSLNAVTDYLSQDPFFLQTLFPILTIPIFISGCLIWRIDETAQFESPPSQPTPFTLKSLVSGPLIPVWIATLIFSTLVAGFMAFATLCAELNQIARPQSLWLSYAIGAVTVRLLASRLPDLLGTHNFVAPSLAVYILSFLLLVDGSTDLTYQAAGLLAGLGHGYCFPVLTSQVISRTPMGGTSRGLALFTALWEVASLATTGPLGLIADRFGFPFMCGLTMVVSIGLLFVWAVAEHHLGPSKITSK